MAQRNLELISDSVSRSLFDKNDPFGSHLLSVESHPVEKMDLVRYAQDFPDRFLRLIRFLPAVRQQIIIEYALNRKTEAQIAKIHGWRSRSMFCTQLAIIRKQAGEKLAGRPITGKSYPRKIRPRKNRVFRDPAWLGSVVVDIADPRISVLFTMRAGQVSNAAKI